MYRKLYTKRDNKDFYPLHIFLNSKKVFKNWPQRLPRIVIENKNIRVHFLLGRYDGFLSFIATFTCDALYEEILEERIPF